MRRFAWFSVAICLLISVPGCRNQATPPIDEPENAVAPGPKFSLADITNESNVHFAYQNAQQANFCTILESLGGGVGLIDFDCDGLADLCFPGGGTMNPDQEIGGLPTGLFRNEGGMRFARADAAGMSPCSFYSHGATVGDYNNDGFPDVLISGYGAVSLWTNQGDGTFVETTDSCGIASPTWNTTAAWGDLNGDGSLDLYLQSYVNWSFQNHPTCWIASGEREICSPKEFAPQADRVFLSNSDGTFREVSKEIGLRDDGKGLGILLLDVDDDSDLDIYVANDTVPNFLYLNDGNGQFSEVGMPHGVALDDRALANGSMGIDAFDYNTDGQLDLWVANYEDESFALYRNEGAGFFLHVSHSTGVSSIGEYFVAFGTAAADFDHDGDEDLVIANGHAIKYPTRSPRRQLPLLLENNEGRFSRTESVGEYFETDHVGRGLAIGDLDNDGDVDVVASHIDDPVSILRNDQTTGQFVTVQLTGVQSNRDAVGARLSLETSRGTMVRQIKSGVSYLSSSDTRVHWGLPDDCKVQKLVIHWPQGNVQEITPLPTGELFRIVEPLSQPTER